MSHTPKLTVESLTSGATNYYSRLSQSVVNGDRQAIPIDTSSPSQLRIRSLTSKLSGIQVNLSEEKQARRADMELKIKQLDERVDRIFSDKGHMSRVKDAIGRLQEGLAQQHVARDMLDEQKTKELRLVESSASLDLNAERTHRKEAENRVLKAIDEKTFNLRMDLANDRKLREEAYDRNQREVRERVAALSTSLREDRAGRDEKYQRAIRRLQEDLLAVTETIEAERKVREQSATAMFQMLEEVSTRMMEDVEGERREREATEETLLKLLEQTCSSVEMTMG